MTAAACPALPGLVPTARQMIVPVVEQACIARDTYRLRLAAPELAAEVVPGQFFMLRQPGTTNPLLGRPFALYDTWLDAAGRPAGVDVAYLVVGKMTSLMSGWQAGDRVEIWGPLGNGFAVPSAERLLLVAGGIGFTPFLAVAREALGKRLYGGRTTARPVSGKSDLPERASQAATLPPSHPPTLLPFDPATLPRTRVTLCYGARNAAYLAGLDDFAALNVDMRLATDDGSRGHKGFVTDLVAEWLDEQAQSAIVERHDAGQAAAPRHNADLSARLAIYCCGPEPMLHAVARLAGRQKVNCWLSLETPMACGFGACFSCVTRVKLPDGGWDYRRVCVEGPVFPAEQLAL